MKNTSSLFLTFISYLTALGAILLLVFATLPLRAQTTTTAETGTNNTLASNVVAVAGTQAQKSSNESSPVRIDDTSIHVGDQNPAHNHKPAFGEDSLGALALLIPIIATSAPFVMIVSIIAIVFYFRHRRNKMAHETLRAMIEKGMPVTPELIAQLRNKPSKSSDQPGQSRHGRLLVGLILLGTGIGVIVIAGKPGWIPLLIGVAFLVVWFVERKDINNGQPPKQ